MILQGFNVSNELTREEMHAHIEPIKSDIDKVVAYMQTNAETTLAIRSDLLVLLKDFKSMQKIQADSVTQHTRDIAELKQHRTETKIYWGLIKWIGGPSVLAVWLSMIGYAISRLTGQ